MSAQVAFAEQGCFQGTHAPSFIDALANHWTTVWAERWFWKGLRNLTRFASKMAPEIIWIVSEAG